MAEWELKHINSFEGPALAIQTTYENRYIRAAMRKILSRLPHRAKGADFGAGYGRLTPILEEYFATAVAFERDGKFISVGNALQKTYSITQIETLSSVPLSNGEVAFSFICTVLHHMVDEDVLATVEEMKRVSGGGFVMLIESTHKGFMMGNYGRDQLFTKGRSVQEYAQVMSPWILDFVRPRHMGGTNQNPPWGSIMMFRDPNVSGAAGPVVADWSSAELMH